MRVEALIQRSPVTIRSSATIKQAAELFVKENIGLLVITSSSRPVIAKAVLSERDIIRAAAAGTPLNSPLDKFTTKKVVAVKRSDPLSKAMEIMATSNIRHLVVENDDGTLFGVLSIRDFFRESSLLEGFRRAEAAEVHGGD